MTTITDVEQALRTAAEPSFAEWVEGFVVEICDHDRLRVSWCAPAALDTPGLELYHLEHYAAILRAVGIKARLVIDSPRSWVVCLPEHDRTADSTPAYDGPKQGKSMRGTDNKANNADP